jgi:hypothetical protein
MYTCPSYFFEVWITWTLGRQPSDSAFERMANAPESIAWLAIIAARIATTKVGQNKGPAPAKEVSSIFAVFIVSPSQEAKV